MGEEKHSAGTKRATTVVKTENSQQIRRLFPKHRRLLHRSEFLWVQRKGKRYQVEDLIACVCATPDEATRVGITTSKKVGNAVVRNRIRRLLREAVRRLLFPAMEQGIAIVLIAKKDLSLDLPQARIDTAIEQLMEQIQKSAPRVRANNRKRNHRATSH